MSSNIWAFCQIGPTTVWGPHHKSTKLSPSGFWPPSSPRRVLSPKMRKLESEMSLASGQRSSRTVFTISDGSYPRLHIIWIIPCGSYHMDHLISLSYGPSHMDHLIWTILHGSHHHYHMDHLTWFIWAISAQDDGDGE